MWKAFLDFDGVLFDIQRFKEDYFRAGDRFGITPLQTEEAYKAMKKKIGRDDPALHAELLSKRFPRVQPKILLTAFLRLRGRASKYLYPDTKPFLRELKRRGFKVFIVSQGDKKAQERKIYSSGLTRLLDGVYVIPQGHKARIVRKLLRPQDDAVFFDDAASEIEEMKKAVPHSFVIHVVRDKKRMKISESADWVVQRPHAALRLIPF